MAWHLRYTSAAAGPTGRSGFQFVSVTPGTPDEITGAVAPYMTYRPPPSAPLRPGPEELAAFPVSLGYDRIGDRGLLVCCRYLGRDYSGRYGNFLGHAVVADEGELEGIRPIEFWHSPTWGEDEELVPGSALDPEMLAEWLAGRSDDDLLAALVNAVGAALRRGHGRVVLLADDVELIARWIAIVSYSLPPRISGKVSFVTYAADPDAAPQLIVGTTPDCWSPDHGEVAFRLDVLAQGDHLLEPPGKDSDGRFGRVIAGRWRAGDLSGIDAIGELASVAEDFQAAAALAAMCDGDASVTLGEEESVAGLIRRSGTAVPSWVWQGLAPAVPRLRFDLAAALWESAIDPGLGRRCAERCVRLALADPAFRDRLPAGLRCEDGMAAAFGEAVANAASLVSLAEIAVLADRLGGELAPAGLSSAAAGLARSGDGSVRDALGLVPGMWREPFSDGVLTGLAAADRLDSLWDGVPDPAECARLVRRLPPSQHAALDGVICAAFAAADLDSAETSELADTVLATASLAGTEARATADTVLARSRALRATEPAELARLLGVLDGGLGVVGAAGFSAVASGLSRRGARAQAAVLAAASDGVRSRLVGLWLAGGDRVDLAELAVRVRQAGVSDPRLDEWARSAAGRRLGRRHLQSALADRDARLAEDWRKLFEDRRGEG